MHASAHIKDITLEDNNRNLYHVSISFLTPNEATIPIAAQTKEHAVEIAQKLFAGRTNFQIHDIYNVKDCPDLDEPAIDQDVEEDKETVH
jgi:hypothetical protein